MRTARARVRSADRCAVRPREPLVLVSVICWPTMGARSVSNASMNCSMSRRVCASGMPTPGPEQVVAEHDRAEEAEHRVDDAVVRQAEAADLVAEVAALGDVEEARVREAEHADLRIDVAQVRDLHDLRDAFEARLAVGAEEALGAVDDVAAVAVEACCRRRSRCRPSAARRSRSRARGCAAVSELSSVRTGFGGSCTCSWKSVNRCMSCGVGMLARPSSPSNATMKLLNDRFASNGGCVRVSTPKKPLARSPRQCMAPALPCRAASASSSGPSSDGTRSRCRCR